jgi:pilus assembly protein CpaB
MLAEGKRAITVRTNDVVGVAGFITPGSFVDVLVSTSSGPDGQPVSKIVLEKMLVLAVAQDVERDPSQAKVANAVTLEVTPEQAEALDLARTIGNLSLALRNPREDGLVDTAGATRGSVLGTSQPPTSPVAAASADPAAPRRTTSGARTLLAGITPAAAASAAASPVGPEPTCVKVVRGDSHTMECF